MSGEALQRRKDADVVLRHRRAAGSRSVARDDQRDLEDVDRIEAETFAVERRLRVDRSAVTSRLSAWTISCASSCTSAGSTWATGSIASLFICCQSADMHPHRVRPAGREGSNGKSPRQSVPSIASGARVGSCNGSILQPPAADSRVWPRIAGHSHHPRGGISRGRDPRVRASELASARSDCRVSIERVRLWSNHVHGQRRER